MNPPLHYLLRAIPQEPAKEPPPLLDRSKAQEAPTQPGGGTGTTKDGSPNGQPSLRDACGTQQIVMIVGIFLIFYLLMIRPQQKQEKERRAMLAALAKGDKVVTSGGIHGVVKSLDENTVTVQVDQRSTLVLDRANIARRSAGSSEAAND